MRGQVLERDNGICAKCKADCELIKRVYYRMDSVSARELYGKAVGFNGKVFWEMDHILERAVLVDNSLRNLQTLCMLCHREKTSRFMVERKSQSLVKWRDERLEKRREREIEEEYHREQARLEKAAKTAPVESLNERKERHYDYVIDFVEAFIAKRRERNPDWPKAMEPIYWDSHPENPGFNEW